MSFLRAVSERKAPQINVYENSLRERKVVYEAISLCSSGICGFLVTRQFRAGTVSFFLLVLHHQRDLVPALFVSAFAVALALDSVFGLGSGPEWMELYANSSSETKMRGMRS